MLSVGKGTYEICVPKTQFPSGLVVSRMRRRKVSGIRADKFTHGPSFFRLFGPIDVDIYEDATGFKYHEDPRTGIWFMSHKLLMVSPALVIKHVKPGQMVCFVGTCNDFTVQGQYNVANKQSMYSGNFDRRVTVPANTIMTVLNVFSYEDPSSVKLKIMNIRFLASSNVHSIVEMEALDYDF